ncbi:MAG: aminotransferase class V-fold PLP-dependent enzyme [Streptosporangiaceae bacterium]
MSGSEQIGLNAQFEDGTVNFLGIPDVTAGLAWIGDIGIDLIHRRVGYLTSWLLGCLAGLKHGNGTPMVRLYGPPDGEARGGTVAFNFLDARGAVVDERAVVRRERGRHLAAGRLFLQPGGRGAGVRADPAGRARGLARVRPARPADGG